MHRFFIHFPLKNRHWLVSAVLGATLVCQAHAQEPQGPGIAGQAEAPKDVTTLQSEQMTGRPDREVFLERDVQVDRGFTRITSDSATYYQEDNVIEADGHIHVTNGGDEFWGDRLRYNMDTGEGWLLNPRYKLAINKAQGKGNRADFESHELSTVDEGTYSTCSGDDPDWYVSASTLRLNHAEETGEATGALLFFKKVPILGAPYLSFPLTTERKSGFLPPTFGTSTSGGFEFMLPYYFNIAPHHDLTLYPKYIGSRGTQLGGEARYLERSFSGDVLFEYLDKDEETRKERYAFATRHTQTLMPRMNLSWNINHVSDSDYLTDFTSHFPGFATALTGIDNASTSVSAQRLLLRTAGLDYGGANWATNLRVTNYQILQDEEATAADKVVGPYQRLPQLSYRVWNANVRGLDWHVQAEWTRFWLERQDLLIHRNIANAAAQGEFGDTGNRLILKPQLSYALMRPGYFIKPKVTLHAAHYGIQNEFDATREGRNFNMVVPIYSLDSGLVFERPAPLFGKDYIQTLEPRLFYVYTPYRDQSAHPNFDSADPGLTFAQLFSENRFSGADRISDADQLTAAVISRFIEPNGVERAKFSIGQRFYYKDQQVYLGTPSKSSRSDLLFTANASLIPTVNIEGAFQYSETNNEFTSGNLTVQWKPGYQKVFNVSYRYLQNTETDTIGIDQINVSTQWPIYKRWNAVGLVSYSLPDSTVIQGMAGFEYNADCWVFRVVGQRLYTATNTVENSYFIQLQLNGFSKIGTNALEALREAISGFDYQQTGSRASRN